MSGKSIHPRYEQIAELTRSRVLPLEPIPDVYLEFIADCLLREWRELVRTHGAAMLSDEVEANALMCSRLKNLEGPLWEDLVSGVERSEVISYDGSHLEKKPDLSLSLTRPRSPFNLEVECKLINHPNSKTVGLYAEKGLTRFLRGEYAWARREAFMLAYVWDGSSIADRLTPFFEGHQRSEPDPYGTEQLPALVGNRTDLARSTHTRSFSYPLHSSSPGPIVIWHLWLEGGKQ
jgi:hypothetical protein